VKTRTYVSPAKLKDNLLLSVVAEVMHSNALCGTAEASVPKVRPSSRFLIDFDSLSIHVFKKVSGLKPSTSTKLSWRVPTCLEPEPAPYPAKVGVVVSQNRKNRARQ